MNPTTSEIILYGTISPEDVNAGNFISELRQIENKYSTINIRINSVGGSVFDGLAIYNALRQSNAHIETYIDGLAASMASIICLAGKKCNISKSARIMTHLPTVSSVGNSEDLKQSVLLLDGIEKTMLTIYSEKTGKSIDECKHLFMNGRDNWFNAQEAISVKLADNIYDLPGIVSPLETNDANSVYDFYSKQKFAAVFTNSQKAMQNPNENRHEMTEEEKKLEFLKTFNSVRKKRENKLKIDTVEKQLSTAFKERHITDSQLFELKKVYKAHPYELEERLNELASVRLIFLESLSWYDLDRNGLLEEFKKRDFDAFKRKYFDNFKKEYMGEPPKGTTYSDANI